MAEAHLKAGGRSKSIKQTINVNQRMLRPVEISIRYIFLDFISLYFVFRDD